MDVLATLRRLEDLAFVSGAEEGPERNEPAYRLWQNAQKAIAAVAELIAACKERDAAQASYDGIPDGDAAISVMTRWERLKTARSRYVTALARAGGDL